MIRFWHDPALRQAGPILAPAFVYRLCGVGFSLLPALAVARDLSSAESSLLLGVVRAAGFLGGLWAGTMVDRGGIRPPILLGLLLSGLGIGLCGAPVPLALLFVGASVGALGHGLYNPVVRMAVGTVVEPAHQQAAVAWMRTAINLAVLIGFGLVAIAADLGLGVLYTLDAATTVLALFLAWRHVPGVGGVRRHAGATAEGAPDTRWPFALFGLVLLGNFGLYELFMASEAAALERLWPGRGVGFFGLLMVINTVACVAFAVPAARVLRNPARAIPAGLALQGLGGLVASLDLADLWLAAAGMALVTAGEVAITATSGYVLLVLSPAGPHTGKYFAFQSVALDIGRLVGAVMAFPLVVDGARPGLVFALAGLLVTGLALAARPVWTTFAHLTRTD